MKNTENDKDLELQIVATGAHLSSSFGMTVNTIEKDGFKVTERVDLSLSGDSPEAIVQAMGRGTIGFATAFEKMKPDWVVFLGDRYEILSAAQAALVLKIPMVHINGGDVTEGAFDEAIRHSLTKMSHLHFVSHDGAGKRVRQLGENPDNIHNVGFLGLDFIKNTELFSKDEVQKKLNFQFRDKNLLITFHPTTLDRIPSVEQTQEVLKGLDKLGNDVGLIFTKANSDPEGQKINALLDEFVAKRDNAVVHTSLGQKLYLSTMRHVDLVLGNSSSGIYEAPTLKKPTVNIGDRQKGRFQATSIVNCEPICDEIVAAVAKGFAMDSRSVKNPFEGEGSLEILRVMKKYENPQDLLMKKFFEL